MQNYDTPIQKPKIRILGMTLPQLGLLAGMGVVLVIVLLLGLKYVVFAPTVDIPTVTPFVMAGPAGPSTPTPTPIPDYKTAVLTIDDLPAGFMPAPDDSLVYNFNEYFAGITLRPDSQFTLLGLQQEQFVIGWTFVFDDPAERDAFFLLVAHPDDLFATNNKFWQSATGLKRSELANPVPLGELSSGWSLVAMGENAQEHADLVLFAHINYGGIVIVLYSGDQQPTIGAWDVAQKLDDRILDVMVNGPIPTPAAIAFDDLAGVRLTLADLPEGFQAIPDSELKIDETSAAEIEQGGMQVASVFGFLNAKPNAQETVLGFTFAFTSTMGKAVMDQLLAGDELLDAMFAPTPTQRRVPLDISKPIGDRAMSTAIMDMTETGGVRCDVLVFRRWHVGAILFHIYFPGRRQVTVEDLAVKLDEKIQSLAVP
jgi:hypothetical protein